MSDNMFVPLHCHTHFSLLDGVAFPSEYVARAKELGMPGMAITDHGTLSGHRQMYFASKEAEIKPILGVEAYICQDRFDKRDRSERTLPLDLVYNHIILLAKNQEGLKNLGIMNEIAWTEGFYRKPRIDMEVLEKYREGIMVSSACMSGLIAKAIEFDDLARAKELVVWFKDRFADDFYIEVMPHNGIKLNLTLLELADKYDVKPVVTPDCHHATADQREIQEMMLLINSHVKKQAGATYETSVKFADMMQRLDHLYGERFLTFKNFKIHMLSPAEMQHEMQEQGIERIDIYSNTLGVLEKVEDYGLTKTDTVELPVDFNDPQRELALIALEGLSRRELVTKEYFDRLHEELALIEEKNFAAYFLIVYDMINWAREQGIRVGPGRGSSAGSLVCYALGITQVDPLKYGLLFSRFIDPSRMDMPDIDSDIMDSRRDEIKQYLADKYKNVASVATFMEFSDKGIVRDISRVLSIDLSDVNKVLKKCNDWEDFLDNDSCKWFHDKYPEVAKYGAQIKGRIRGTGAHAAGVVLSRESLRNFAPIETRARPKGEDRLVVVGLDGDEAAEAGLTKIDVLGLKTLTVIDDCVKVIQERHGLLIDLDKINLEEPSVYKLLSSGFTKGVFQCEATPYTNLLVKMKVKNLNELAASNALVRPGAANTIGKDYIARKNGKDVTTYPNEALRQITKDTYGCILYQEQVMQACIMLGGMTGGEANKVRKIIGKKRDASEFDVFKDKFIQNATGPIGLGLAEKLWHDFEAHAGYSFNKCAFGDTLVRRAASGRFCVDPNITIEDLYDNWHSKTSVGKKYRSKGVRIMALDADGRVRPQRVKNIYQNGVKSGYKVTLDNGKSIITTSNHKHLTDSGYKMVKDIMIGDTMYSCDFEYEMTDYTGHGLGSGWVKHTANRSVANDGRVRPSTTGNSSEYKRNILLLPPGCAECGSIDGRIEIAHVDSDKANNCVGNLRRLCNPCHKKLDYDFGSRKKRYSKGYSIDKALVVSIEYAGEAMTYDIEMDTLEHNFVANGIVTHNSHAVAYSLLSYWCAWLKTFYPVEFMYALLKNEDDPDMRTQYLIEAKRMGLPVRLPHINKSGLDFEIDGDGLIIGLVAIKYISDKIAERYIAARPFNSYAEVELYTFTKGNGVNSRALAAMKAVGALTFDDNPRDDEWIKTNLYEYLNLPEVEFDMPPWFDAYFKDIADYEEGETTLIKGICKKIKRGNGWSLVEFLDKSGMVGIFDKEDTELEKGKMYAVLVANKRVAQAVPADQIKDTSIPLVKFLNYQETPYGPGEYYVLGFKPRTTKAGKKMASMTLANSEREIKDIIVFPTLFTEAFMHCEPGTVQKFKFTKLDDGGLSLAEIER